MATHTIPRRESVLATRVQTSQAQQFRALALSHGISTSAALSALISQALGEPNTPQGGGTPCFAETKHPTAPVKNFSLRDEKSGPAELTIPDDQGGGGTSSLSAEPHSTRSVLGPPPRSSTGSQSGSVGVEGQL